MITAAVCRKIELKLVKKDKDHANWKVISMLCRHSVEFGLKGL